MLLSIWSTYYVFLSPEDAIKRIKRGGFDTIELSREHLENLFTRADRAKTIAEFRRFLVDNDCPVTQAHLPMLDIQEDNNQPILDALKERIEFLVELGIQNIVLHIGRGLTPPKAVLTKEQLLRRRIDGVKYLVNSLEGSDNYLCLENLVANMKTSSEIKEVIEGVNNKHIAVCYDSGHLNENHTLETQRDFVYNLKDYIRCTHINDNDGVNEMHLIPYAQALDLPKRGVHRICMEEIAHALASIGYDGNINFELPGEINAPERILDAKLKYIAEIGRYFIERIKGDKND